MNFDNKFFKYLAYILLVILIVFFMSKLDFIVQPIGQILPVIVSPILLGGFLYYLLRPMVTFLTDKFQNKILAIVFTLVTIVFFVGLLSYFGGHIISNQFKDLVDRHWSKYSKRRRILLLFRKIKNPE